MDEPTDNSPRRLGELGVESWFFRACDPDAPNAVWIKATTLGNDDGSHVAEAWCSVFEDEDTLGLKTTSPQSDCRFSTDGFDTTIGGCTFAAEGGSGRLVGELEHDRGLLAWDLTFERLEGDLGESLCMLPTRRLVDAPIPKNKLLTPLPALRFDGVIERDGRTIEVDGWFGSQGHNWGAAHAAEYAWGQCLFLDASGEPFCYVEGASGRIEVAGRTLPRMSLLTVRRGGREYRFDRLVDLWNQQADIDFPRWSLRMKGPSGEAVLTMEGKPERMVCLGYYNPNGSLSYCLNSKTAAVTLRVNPINDDGFECYSPHGGALEFLQPVEESRVQPVV